MCYSDHNEDIRTKGNCDYCLESEPDICEHGLSAWLCADPMYHYPRD